MREIMDLASYVAWKSSIKLITVSLKLHFPPKVILLVTISWALCWLSVHLVFVINDFNSNWQTICSLIGLDHATFCTMGDFQCSWLADFFETFITLWKIFTVRYICHLFGHRCNCQGMFFVFLNSDCCQLFVIALCYGCLPCRWKFLCPDHIFNCQCVWFALLYLGNVFFKHIQGNASC